MELVEEVDAGHLRAPGLHGTTREAPAEMLRGLRRSGNHRRRGIRGGGANYRRQRLVQFRPLHGSGSRVKASGSFLAVR
jgi:hypothetical protein